MPKKEIKKILEKVVVKVIKKYLPSIAMKKIPVFGIAVGLFNGIKAAFNGDFLTAGSEITSGIFGSTGLGFVVSLGIDILILFKEVGE